MAPKERYVLEDFTNFGHDNFPVEYAAVADRNIYKFETKTCENDNQQPREATLLFLGRYHYTKSGGPLAWAHATASGIGYYSGKPFRVCKPVPVLVQGRI